MIGYVLLKAIGFASLLSSTIAAIGCIPREGGQFIEDTSFELWDGSWDGRNVVIQESTPSLPAHSGNRAVLLTATYSKTVEGVATNNYAWIQQFVYNSRTAHKYRIKAHYKVLTHTKGSSCPDASLPLTACRLKITYVDQVLKSTQLHPTSGYVEIDVPFTPESSGRYFNWNVECKPENSPPGCGEMTLLVDDITWTDPGHVCWRPVGCFVDSPTSRLLPHHGRLPNWPRTTSIESCQEACNHQGHLFAGLENGNECYCGDTIVGHVSAPASECNKPCSWNSQQLCGGVNRVYVHQKP